MRAAMIAWLTIGLGLAGCSRSADVGSMAARNQGRFTGVGVFDAGRLWSQMVTSRAADAPAPAKIADDEHVIVVLDSRTGEVRECGDLSGYCIAVEPWAGPSVQAPVVLAKHAADLAADDRLESGKAAAAR